MGESKILGDEMAWGDFAPRASEALAGRWWSSLSPEEVDGQGLLNAVFEDMATWLLLNRTSAPLSESVVVGSAPILSESIRGLSTRATNVMINQLSGVDLAGLSPQMFLWLRNTGVRTATEMIAAVLRHAFLSATTLKQTEATLEGEGSGGKFVSGGEIYPSAGGSGLNENAITLMRDLETLARWQYFCGLSDALILEKIDSEEAPAEVVMARSRVLNIRASDLVDTSSELNAAEWLDRLIRTFDSREKRIVLKRVLSSDPATLEMLGTDFGVTRERVRQLEAKAVRQLRDAIGQDAQATNLVALLQSAAPLTLPLAEFISRNPVLAQNVPVAEEPLWRLLSCLGTYFEVEHGWAAFPSMSSAVSRTHQAIKSAESVQGNLVPLASVEEILGSRLQPSELAAWVQTCGYTVESQYLLRRSAIQDRVVAVLVVENRAMSSTEIGERLPDRSLTSIKNAMALDNRIVRVDRDRWALEGWGQESYTTIREMIGRILARSGGKTPVAALVDELTSRYDVTPNSVISYAAASPFQLRGGWVEVAKSRHDSPKSAASTRRLYRHYPYWKYRLEVSADHLRGSGFPVPRGVADLVDCQPGSFVELSMPTSTMSLRRTGSQPASSSIRTELERVGARVADTAFLVIEPVHLRAHVEIIHAPDLESSEQQVRRLVGLPLLDHADDIFGELASVLDLPPGSDATSVCAAFKERGERDVFTILVDLVPEVGTDEMEKLSQSYRTPPSDEELLKLFGLG